MSDKDTIYRQAAIDAVRKCSVKEVTPAYMLINKAEVMTELMMLPSAQPEPICVAKVTLTDEQVKEAFEKAKGEILTVLDAQPERKRGKWIIGSLCSTGGAGGAYRVLRCSECDHQEPWPWLTSRNFCPNCGADMRQREEEQNEG